MRRLCLSRSAAERHPSRVYHHHHTARTADTTRSACCSECECVADKNLQVNYIKHGQPIWCCSGGLFIVFVPCCFYRLNSPRGDNKLFPPLLASGGKHSACIHPLHMINRKYMVSALHLLSTPDNDTRQINSRTTQGWRTVSQPKLGNDMRVSQAASCWCVH